MRDCDKIRLIIDELAHASQVEFAETIGVDGSFVCRMLKPEYRLTKKRMMRICGAYPSVNFDFLNGTSDYPGDISVRIVKKRLSEVIATKEEIIRTLTSEIERQGLVIDQLLK